MVVFVLLFIAALLFLIVVELCSLQKTNAYNYSLEGSFDTSLISIIIPARDEEANIKTVLESINRQDDENYELVILVDRCLDSTLEIAEDFSVRARCDVKIIINSEDPPEGKNPKVHLLEKGISEAGGGIFLFTDADCEVPCSWIADYRRLFSEKNTGLVTGALEVKCGWSPLGCFQNFDHIYRSFYAAACSGAGVPTGGFGNNLGIRRECYFSLGGFDNLPESVTEDAVLVSSVGNSGSYKVRSLSSSAKRVTTLPQLKFSAYLQQSLRWASGAVHSPDKKTRWFYNLLMAGLSLSNLSLLLSIFIPQIILLPAAGFTYLLCSGIIAGIYMRAGKKYWASLLPSVLLFFFFYQISFIRTITNRKIEWKGSVLTARA